MLRTVRVRGNIPIRNPCALANPSPRGSWPTAWCAMTWPWPQLGSPQSPGLLGSHGIDGVVLMVEPAWESAVSHLCLRVRDIPGGFRRFQFSDPLFEAPRPRHQPNKLRHPSCVAASTPSPLRSRPRRRLNFPNDHQMDLEFLPYYFWVCMWCSLFTILVSIFDLCALMKHVTMFSEDARSQRRLDRKGLPGLRA